MCYDGDSADVWIETRRRARKGRTCDECGAIIARGLDYLTIALCYREEGWSRLSVHVECMALWRFVQKEVCGGNGLIMIGGLSDELDGYDENIERDDEGEPLSGQVTLADVYEAIREGHVAYARA